MHTLIYVKFSIEDKKFNKNLRSAKNGKKNRFSVISNFETGTKQGNTKYEQYWRIHDFFWVGLLDGQLAEYTFV